MSQRVTAVVLCPLCAWNARHTADNAGEVVEFLTARRQAHVAEVHAAAASTSTQPSSTQGIPTRAS